MDLTIKEVKYKTGAIDGFKQFHIWRRIMPIVLASSISVREIFSKAPKAAPPVSDDPATVKATMDKVEAQAEDLMMRAFRPAIELLSKMSDEDSEYVIKVCLSACHRESGAGFAPVMSTQGQLMFQDMGVQEMMQLSSAVIRENMGNFFDALPSLV